MEREMWAALGGAERRVWCVDETGAIQGGPQELKAGPLLAGVGCVCGGCTSPIPGQPLGNWENRGEADSLYMDHLYTQKTLTPKSVPHSDPVSTWALFSLGSPVPPDRCAPQQLNRSPSSLGLSSKAGASSFKHEKQLYLCAWEVGERIFLTRPSGETRSRLRACGDHVVSAAMCCHKSMDTVPPLSPMPKRNPCWDYSCDLPLLNYLQCIQLKSCVCAKHFPRAASLNGSVGRVRLQKPARSKLSLATC